MGLIFLDSNLGSDNQYIIFAFSGARVLPGHNIDKGDLSGDENSHF